MTLDDMNSKKRRKALIPTLVFAAVLVAVERMGWLPVGDGPSSAAGATTAEQAAPSRVAELAAGRRSGEMVRVTGTVERVLADDNDGSRHQRFIVRVGDLTLLVAHNIDLAPRVPLAQGDTLELYGQYEWNDKGGVLHWTHHDPRGRHADGWIEHAGQRYE